MEEACINHLIHRDYTVLGSEVHIDIYDDRLEFFSPGGMFDGTSIQDQDPLSVPSVRRNPVIADVLSQLSYMEKRGSGFKKMKLQTSLLPTYTEEKKPTTTSIKKHLATLKDMGIIERVGPDKGGYWKVLIRK